MSVLFGRWSFDGVQASPECLAKVRRILSRYGPDGGACYSSRGLDLLYYAFHTTRESRLEIQPHVSESNAVVTWDGRLDNRTEVLSQLGGCLTRDSADVSIVSAAYEQWGTDCFRKLIGDWAVAIWNPKQRLLILAKDPIGTRHLYYTIEKDVLSWCSILDPLVLLAGRTFKVNEEYIAGWFSFFPAVHLTPYVGIDSVPPSCFVRLECGRRSTSKYWDFNPKKTIHYDTDEEYEDHFRAVLAESVQRRLRSDSPILAELSGGMDSSSIVCMADTMMSRGAVEAPRLDTLSYYNDTEPNWNERPYFAQIEQKRGRVGRHINVSTKRPLNFEFEREQFAATPAHRWTRPSDATQQFAACMASQGNRVVLSGIGGDEVMGGVPTPTAELMDLLATVRFRSLARQLKIWALNTRKPWFHLLLLAVRGFVPVAFCGVAKHIRPVGWLQPDFIRRQRNALTGYPSRVKVSGSPPSFQENVRTLNALRRQLSCAALSSEPCYEKRYPYLDRELLEFIYAVPRQQILRPGQRRSLMRRALVGIVPDQILNRRRKAFLVQSPLKAVVADWGAFVDFSRHMVSASTGLVEPKFFLEAVNEARMGTEIATVTLLRTISVEFWLRGLKNFGVSEGTSSIVVPHADLRRGRTG